MTQTTLNVGDLGKQQPRMPVKAPQMTIERNAVVFLLKKLADDNYKYFKQQEGGAFATRIAEACHEISVSTDLVKELVGQLHGVSRICDYDENTPGNGFRSLICICDVAILRLISVLRDCSENRTTIMFRVSHYCKGIESFGAVLRFLLLAFHQVISLMEVLEDLSLFPPLDSEYNQFNVILRSIEALDSSCFYGRALGFQFSQSMTRIFRIIGIVLATYSLSWESQTSAIDSLLRSGKLLLNPEERAVRIIKVTREADIEFCRAFWNLSEILEPKLFCPTMALCECREIPLDGPMPLETVNGGTVFIPEASAHTGRRPVNIRVISFNHRVGLSSSVMSHKLPLSSNLLIHCHGGAYVATSSKSHEAYLRFWAKALDCPVVSIDYSLAPENPFPRPTEEVLYAYAWILNNSSRLGWTGERVCMVGDSAGGNLIMSVNLRLIELNVKRMPDGIVPIYTPFLFQYLPSPSRVLSFMDPLLHMGVVIRCAAAYTGVRVPLDSDDLKQGKTLNDENRNDQSSGDGRIGDTDDEKPRKSLLEYVNQVQKAHLDFSHGSQSIVSLINLSQDNIFFHSNSPSLSPIQNKVVDGLSDAESCEDEKPKDDIMSGIGDVAAAPDFAYEDADDDLGADEKSGIAQTVHVIGDPVHICLSSAHADQELIDYLQLHSITKNSIDNNTEALNKIEEIDNMGALDDDNDEEVFGAVDDTVTRTLNISFPRSWSTGSLAIFFNRSNNSSRKNSRYHDSAGRTPIFNSSPRKTPAFFSSAGRTPVFADKRKTSRHRSLSESFTETAVLAAGHVYDNIIEWFDAPKTPIGHVDKHKLSRAAAMSTRQAAKLQLEESATHESHFTEMLKMKLPRNYLVSPLYAPKELLCKLPPIRFVACHLDPLLDDTVMFARKVRDCGGRVESIDLLNGLPHGFLNFTPMSAECYEGADLCLRRIMDVLKPDSGDNFN